MDALKFVNGDFELHVRCSGLSSAFEKARAKQPNLEDATSYAVPNGNFYLIDFETNDLLPNSTNNTRPVFFENKDYTFGIRFKDKSAVESPFIYSRLKEIQSKFYYEKGLGYLSGTINFGNDIGKSEIILRFSKNNAPHEFVFGFEVFPTKLDYRNDHSRMIRDIEEEYPHLVMDFLKRTYSSFQLGGSESTDIIWWQVFGGLYQRMISSADFILSRPRSRLVRDKIRLPADRIKKWTSRMEERFGERRFIPRAKYTLDRSMLTSDTVENRFFKHAMLKTAARYKRIKNVIEKKYAKDISEEFGNEIRGIEKNLDRISAHAFFRAVSDFTGLRQESLVLQKATGYSNIYRSWVMLNRGLTFFEGIQRIELKNIAELYQIWCFLQIKGVLQSILGKERPDDTQIGGIRVDNFVFHIEEGVTSRVAFIMENGDRVELFHEFTYNKAQNAEVRSYTVNQRPDIVLKIIKNDLRERYALTYLYDAKYRLLSDDDPNSPDLPPEEAINQMHRYRDAIYYVNRLENRPEKEVIGAYVLFPGRGKIDSIRESGYYNSIADVNIGALPLVPNDHSNKELLVDHLSSILGLGTEEALRAIAPQKLSSYETPNPEVLIGIVKDMSHAYCYVERTDRIYYTGSSKPTHFGYKSLRYFAPYLTGRGITEYFEILSYEIVPRNRIFEADEPLHVRDDHSERLVLRLGKRFQLSASGQAFKLSDSVIRHFRYTKLAHLRNAKEGRIETLKMSKRHRSSE